MAHIFDKRDLKKSVYHKLPKMRLIVIKRVKTPYCITVLSNNTVKKMLKLDKAMV
jgi:hypothetical protein